MNICTVRQRSIASLPNNSFTTKNGIIIMSWVPAEKIERGKFKASFKAR